MLDGGLYQSSFAVMKIGMCKAQLSCCRQVGSDHVTSDYVTKSGMSMLLLGLRLNGVEGVGGRRGYHSDPTP